MTGDPDLNLHPSHILGGILKVLLLHIRLLVRLSINFFQCPHPVIAEKKFLSVPRSCILTPPLRLNVLLVAQADLPNIFYDLREPEIENAIYLPYLNRLPNVIDFYQLITSPPIHHMTLWHRKLPWQINIEASQPNGITIYDLFRQLYRRLHQPIIQEEYYTDELAASDREILMMAFQTRCAMFPDQLKGGVRRIDFLGQEVCFIGLKHCRGGRWEFKSQLPPPKERMIIVGFLDLLSGNNSQLLIRYVKLGLNTFFNSSSTIPHDFCLLQVTIIYFV